MSTLDTSLALPDNIAAFLDVYARSIERIRRAYDTLAEAQTELDSMFGSAYSCSDVTGRHAPGAYWTTKEPGKYADAIQKEIDKKVWRRILDRLGAGKVLSAARQKKIDEQIEAGQVGPVDTETILRVAGEFMQAAPDMARELYAEAFEALRPPHSQLKTNHLYRIGPKVIIACLDHSYNGKMRVSHWREAKIASIDKAFHLLDGKPIPGGYRTPLIDAVNTTPYHEKGSTEYFTFEGFGNGNLHITFRRPDLVAALNRAGGEATGSGLPGMEKR